MECGAIIDVLKLMGIGQKEVLIEGDGLLVIVSMLIRMSPDQNIADLSGLYKAPK